MQPSINNDITTTKLVQLALYPIPSLRCEASQRIYLLCETKEVAFYFQEENAICPLVYTTQSLTNDLKIPQMNTTLS